MVVDGLNHPGPARVPARGRPRRDTDRVAFGLCDTCEHQQIVRNTRGSVFSLCRRSRADPTFPRYPRMPVLECRGHEPRSEADGAGEAPGGPGAGTSA